MVVFKLGDVSSTFPHRLVRYDELHSIDESNPSKSTVAERDGQLASRFRNDAHFDGGVVLHFQLVHDAVRHLDPIAQSIRAPVHRLRELDLHNERNGRIAPPRERRCQFGGGMRHHEDGGLVRQSHVVREAARLEFELGLRVPRHVAVESEGRRVHLVDGAALPGRCFQMAGTVRRDVGRHVITKHNEIGIGVVSAEWERNHRLRAISTLFFPRSAYYSSESLRSIPRWGCRTHRTARRSRSAL